MYIQVKFFFGYFSYTESPWYLPFPSKDLDINIYVRFKNTATSSHRNHSLHSSGYLFIYLRQILEVRVVQKSLPNISVVLRIEAQTTD